MERIWKNVLEGLHLLVSGNTEIYQILFLSLRVSLLAVLMGILIGIPIGTFLGLRNFPGKGIIANIIYTLMGLPPVVVGVVVFLLLSNIGPFGSLGLLFSPTAMVIAQFLLVTPIIIGLTMTAVESKDKLLSETLKTLGATRVQTAWTVVKEARGAILIAVVTGLGRALAEVGAVMLVGGNIRFHTRVMTTSIVMETNLGNFGTALALGIILICVTFILQALLQIINKWLGVNHERSNLYS